MLTEKHVGPLASYPSLGPISGLAPIVQYRVCATVLQGEDGNALAMGIQYAWVDAYLMLASLRVPHGVLLTLDPVTSHAPTLKGVMVEHVVE